MTFTYKTKGVCSYSIDITIQDDVIKLVQFNGGCNGNANGISKLVAGLTVDEVIDKLTAIQCGFRKTSCPDQLAKALQTYKNKEGV